MSFELTGDWKVSDVSDSFLFLGVEPDDVNADVNTNT